MTETVKKWVFLNNQSMTEPVGPSLGHLPRYVLAADYASLEQENARIAGRLQNVQEERDAALKLLAQCQEHLHPHRDAVLWGAVVEALRCAPTK